MRLFTLLFSFYITLFASIHDKSAIVYYGDDISYPTVGIHDYIIVQPDNVIPYTPGFKIYKDKIYAYVSIGEIDRDIPQYKLIKKSWIAAKNKMWSSDVLDIRNKEYQNFLFKTMIDPLRKQGFKNFFFDTLDSFYFYSKTKKAQKESAQALADFINEFHKRYPDAKLIINRGFEIIDQVAPAVTAVLFESYYHGIKEGKDPYQAVSDEDREWLDIQLQKVKKHNIDIISVEYLPPKEIFSPKAQKIIQDLKAKGMIPYIADRDLLVYGNSSKVALKREIFTLIDEVNMDRTNQDSLLFGETILEYYGYKTRFYDVRNGFPPIEKMLHYKGVLIWLQNTNFTDDTKLYNWVAKLIKNNIKVIFIGDFGSDMITNDNLQNIGVLQKDTISRKIGIVYKDKIVGYEANPPMTSQGIVFNLTIPAKKLLTFKYADGSTSTPAAITPWGGYLVNDGYLITINGESLWIVNPFVFFKEALRLEDLPIPDVTTKTGKRVLFTHVDGDGLGNRVEGSYGKYSGDAILNFILKKYKIPHSISIIGSEVDPNGLFPKDYKELRDIVKEIYKIPYVEGATHTYTHPFFWGKVDENGNLDPKYRLKVKGYHFSFHKEFVETLEEINKDFYPKGKTPKANTIFWSGDCIPRINALSYVDKHNLQAINGGDTTITYEHPWLSTIAPLGFERKNFLQIYTGAQNENVFTNDWLGPFWGFKRVIQTFKLTDSPRRLKPIDIYYHLYSGSKKASLNALESVFDWAIKQDTHPIFTSEYIPTVKEFFNYSIAKDNNNSYLLCGLDNLRTIRYENSDIGANFEKSNSVIGIKHFQNHTYFSLKRVKQHFLTLDRSQNHTQQPYLISANGDVTTTKAAQKIFYNFKGYVPLQFDFHVPQECSFHIQPNPAELSHQDQTYNIKYKKAKEAKVWIECSN